MNVPLQPTFAFWGGWGEIVLVAVPLTVLWLVLVMANRRAKRR